MKTNLIESDESKDYDGQALISEKSHPLGMVQPKCQYINITLAENNNETTRKQCD
jgi:hypothetical protein